MQQKLLTVTEPTGGEQAREHPAVRAWLEDGWRIIWVTPIGVTQNDVATFVLIIEKG